MNKQRSLIFALLITIAAALPLKAAEQCCAPCASGVLVGVTADSCGTCMDLAKFIPGCESADTNGCTACKTGFTLSNGACTSTQAATVNGIHCSIRGKLDYQDADFPFNYAAFIPNCLACTTTIGCQTCASGTTRTLSAGIYTCK